MNDNIRNQTRSFYAMYAEMTFDNIALFARDLDVREDGIKYGKELIENRRKTR